MKSAKAIWVLLAASVLALSLYSFDGKPNSDIGVFLVWSMLVLAFPTSVLVAVLLSAASIFSEKFFSMVVLTNYWSITIGWLCFFAAGYWQWFLMLPWLWRKWKTRRMASSDGAA